MHHSDFMVGRNFMLTGQWVPLITGVFIILCFYFTLTFFQYLKTGEARIVHQSKIAAIICLALALLTPALYQMLFFPTLMR